MAPRPLPITLALALSGAFIAAFLVRAVTGVGGEAFEGLATTVLYNGSQLLSVIVLLAGATRPGRDRLAWSLLGIGTAMIMLGDVVWTILYGDGAEVSIPSLPDAFYLGGYLPMVVAAVLVLRSRLGGNLRSGLWLDGIISGLAVATIFSAVVIEPIGRSLGGRDAMYVAVGLAYPLVDLLLLGIIITACAVRGWRLDARWLGLCAGAVLYAVADGVYLLQVMRDTYVVGGLLDVIWIVAAWIWAATAWMKAPADSHPDQQPTRVAVFAPVLLGLAAIFVFLLEGIEAHADRLTIGVAFATAIAVFARFVITSMDNVRLLEGSRRDATTDALTGLGNRRALNAELDAPAAGRRLLVLFDLDGFKAYNDTFGHPAGDRLLAIIGDALAAAVRGRGRAFRMGGDEFCAIVASGGDAAEAAGRRIAAALVQSGHGFHVSASFGVVAVPDEATTATDALRIADRRLYANKRGDRAPAAHQSIDVLLAMLAERHPDLGEHGDRVSELAGELACRLGRDERDVELVRRAAALHDIGTIAIPERIIATAGPLEADELELIRQHTIIGERILTAAPALATVGEIVRASHERWDGTGYPDGLGGEAIPLAARIVFVCGAYDAMVSDRPHQAAMPADEALRELRRCAGTQFDPQIVAAFAAMLAARAAAVRV